MAQRQQRQIDRHLRFHPIIFTSERGCVHLLSLKSSEQAAVADGSSVQTLPTDKEYCDRMFINIFFWSATTEHPCRGKKHLA